MILGAMLAEPIRVTELILMSGVVHDRTVPKKNLRIILALRVLLSILTDHYEPLSSQQLRITGMLVYPVLLR